MTEKDEPSFSSSSPHAEELSNPPSNLSPGEQARAESAGAEGETKTPLPPLPAPPPDRRTPQQLAAEVARLDRALVAVVLALAFLLASVAIRNSDFWMHLASGRLLAQGQYQFGVDPFSYTSTAYWTNHAWLYDLILYGVTRAAGGPESEGAGAVLVVLKALLITVLAGFMLQIRRPREGLWIPVVCTGLALLAMSPRLLLQPILISLLFLCLTLFILQRPERSESAAGQAGGNGRSSLAGYWLLVPLFVLWVNLDSWFLLGPLTVALYLIGQTLQRLLSSSGSEEDTSQPRQLRMLSMVLLAGLAACLLNPHHYHAYSLPARLSGAASSDVLEREDLFRPFFYWLFQEDYWQSYAAWTPASLAFWPVLVLGLASFACTLFTGWRWWRFTVWLAFLVLAGYQVRTMPFFAVVAAPITALNWQDFLASWPGTQPQSDRLGNAWSLAGRLLTLLLGMVLLAAAWSGWLYVSWLNGVPTSGPAGRRVAWAVDIEPSLRQTALQLRAWRDQGQLQPDDRGFQYSPDVVNYCAWFCPAEKGFFDYRFNHFSRPLTTEYIDLRQALRGNPPARDESGERPLDWQKLFRERHIKYVVLFGTDTSPLNPGVPNSLQASVWMLFDPQHWKLLYMDGRATIFGWNESGSTDSGKRPALPRLNPNELAFGAQPERAPVQSSEQGPSQRDLAARWLHRPPVAALDEDLAARYLSYFNLIRQQWPYPDVVATEIANWSGLIAGAPVNVGTVSAPGMLALRSYPDFLTFRNPNALEYFLRDKPLGPAAAPLLAVRAARRAIAASPDYPESYFVLAEAYALLWRDQEEHWVGRSLPAQDVFPRQILRDSQMLTALEYYAMLLPQDGEAHRKLAQNYARLGYWDLALEHLRAATEYFAARGPNRRESRDEFKQRIEQMDKDLGQLKADVKKREDDYQVDARDKPLSRKVQKALQNGLIKRARDLLLQADPVQIGPVEIDVLLRLLLSTGRPDQARAVLSEGLRSGLGPKYEWYNALIAAASGNYQEAGRFLDEYTLQFEQSSLEGVLRLLQMQTFDGGLSPQSLFGVNTVSTRLRELADWRVLRGLLALEAGENAVAAKRFQAALDIGNQKKLDFESRPIAEHYLRRIEHAHGDR
jgi:hypothetical protein